MTGRHGRIPKSRPGAHRDHRRRGIAGRDEPLVLERLVPYRIAVLSNLLTLGASQPLARRFSLATREWRIVAVLGEGPPVSSAELARRIGAGERRTSRVVANLVRRGLVDRKPEAFDARRTLVELSRKGRALYRRAVPHALAQERALLSALTPVERRTLAALLAKLLREAAAMLERSAGPATEGDDA